jgi:hypothetical protein
MTDTSESVSTSSNLPNFTFTEEEIAAIKEAAGAVDVDETQPTPVNEIRPKRRPGRPRKDGRPTGSGPLPVAEPIEVKDPSFPPAALTKREEREVATRIASILTGTTGMAGMVKPYLPMTDEEAEAIATPLASYLIRNEPTSGIAREILENYDLLAIVLGVGSYSVRVYRDRKVELESRRPDNTTVTQRISELQTSNNGRGPDERASDNVSIPNASRSGPTPFDV